MSPTGTTSAQSTNGSAASTAAAKAKEAGGSVASAAKSAKGPALAAGATVAGLAGGLVLGTRMSSSRRKVLGLPIGRKRPMVRAAEALGKVAKELGVRERQGGGDDARGPSRSAISSSGSTGSHRSRSCSTG